MLLASHGGEGQVLVDSRSGQVSGKFTKTKCCCICKLFCKETLKFLIESLLFYNLDLISRLASRLGKAECCQGVRFLTESVSCNNCLFSHGVLKQNPLTMETRWSVTKPNLWVQRKAKVSPFGNSHVLSALSSGSPPFSLISRLFCPLLLCTHPLLSCHCIHWF